MNNRSFLKICYQVSSYRDNEKVQAETQTESGHCLASITKFGTIRRYLQKVIYLEEGR
jgi:hypothetical protein